MSVEKRTHDDMACFFFGGGEWLRVTQQERSGHIVMFWLFGCVWLLVVWLCLPLFRPGGFIACMHWFWLRRAKQKQQAARFQTRWCQAGATHCVVASTPAAAVFAMR